MISKSNIQLQGTTATPTIEGFITFPQLYPIQRPVNDQVIEYDFKNATWKSLSELPLSVRVGDIIYTFNLKIISKITASHPNLPVQIAVLLTGKFR